MAPFIDRTEDDKGVDKSRDQHSEQSKGKQWPNEARNTGGSCEQKSK
jgi:hypothetical protein